MSRNRRGLPTLALAAIALLGLPCSPMTAQPSAPHTLFILADSPAASRPGLSVGWADVLGSYFDDSRLHVLSYARGATSSRDATVRGRVAEVLNAAKAGDYLLISFSVSESRPLDTPLGSLPGMGDDTTRIVGEDGHPETVHTYGWYVGRMIADAQAKGVIPIVVSSSMENRWKAGAPRYEPNLYDAWAVDLSQKAGIAYLDIRTLERDLFTCLGRASTNRLFAEAGDAVHRNAFGARDAARCIVARLAEANPGGITRYLNPGEAEEAIAGLPTLANHGLGPAPRDAAKASLPTLFIIGDQSARIGRGHGLGYEWGWGDALAGDFPADKLNVRNHGNATMGARGYFESEDWPRVQSELRPGDVLLIAFGYNEIVDKDETRLARWDTGGEASRDVGGRETHSYPWYLHAYIVTARMAKARPILCSPLRFNPAGGAAFETRLVQADSWAQQVAKSDGVPYFDALDVLPKVPPESAMTLYSDPEIALSKAGALCVARGFSAFARDTPEAGLAAYLGTGAQKAPVLSP